MRCIGTYDYDRSPFAFMRRHEGGYRLARRDQSAVERRDWDNFWVGPFGGRYERDAFSEIVFSL